MAKRARCRCGRGTRICSIILTLAAMASLQLWHSFRVQTGFVSLDAVVTTTAAQSWERVKSSARVTQELFELRKDEIVAQELHIKPKDEGSEGEEENTPSLIDDDALLDEPDSPVDSVVDSEPPKSMSDGTRLLGIYKQLCNWRAWSAGKIRKLSAERKDNLTHMFAPLVEMQPPAPIKGQRPGGKLSKENVDCNLPNLKEKGILTGKLAQHSRVLVDMFTGMGGGAELELLELRLHELDGVADIVVVTESRFGNRCDLKPLHFTRQKQRFTEFLPRILHVETDRCPDYVKKASNCHKKKPSQRPHSIYFQEEMQRACASKVLSEERSDLPDDALVLVSDLDEIPDGKTLLALKHCEWKAGLRLPVKLELQVVPFNLRNMCPATRAKYIKGNIALWSEVKLGKRDLLWPKPHTDLLPRAGVHLSAYGSRAQLDYRFINHGESGIILPLIGPQGEKKRICEVTTIDQLNALQKQLNDNPLSVIRSWEKRDPNKKLGKVNVADLRSCNLPWPLLTSPARYPFFWGEGTWS